MLSINQQYNKNGYFFFGGLFREREIAQVSQVVDKFHSAWTKENQQFYADKAVNSAYLTGTKYLSNCERKILFEFIAGDAINRVVSSLPFTEPAFLNTQLFFNPLNQEQENYWHRDPQYHLTLAEQKKALQRDEVIHLRLALHDEPGIELVPGTHRRWDTDEELDVRLERSGNKSYQNLSTALVVRLKKGDLLAFSANMIHRGLYGGDRKALDMLFCEAKPELLKFVDDDCLPDTKTLEVLNRPLIFMNTIKARSKN